jgi:hypothetical protein
MIVGRRRDGAICELMDKNWIQGSVRQGELASEEAMRAAS